MRKKNHIGLGDPYNVRFSLLPRVFPKHNFSKILICSYRKIPCIVTTAAKCRGLLRWYILIRLLKNKYFKAIHLILESTSEDGLYHPPSWQQRRWFPKCCTFIIPISSGATKELWKWIPNSLPQSWSRCMYWIFHAVLLVYHDASCKYLYLHF